MITLTSVATAQDREDLFRGKGKFAGTQFTKGCGPSCQTLQNIYFPLPEFKSAMAGFAVHKSLFEYTDIRALVRIRDIFANGIYKADDKRMHYALRTSIQNYIAMLLLIDRFGINDALANKGLFEKGGKTSWNKIKKVIDEGFTTITSTPAPSSAKNAITTPTTPKLVHSKEITGFHDRQVIYYGAPGTGKSYAIKQVEEDTNNNLTQQNIIRTTFHPASDYASFVGCYKPRKIADTNDLTYEFVAQAFMTAYIRAWKGTDPVLLVIEEINRGDCAQIFGDIFQLLDRNDKYFSQYPIEPDTDIKDYLKLKETAFYITEREGFTSSDKYFNDVNIGDKLLLPDNLYIWATMNTSDQSLFPMDSAFKRRWEWKYVPISKGKDKAGKALDWTIEINGKRYEWYKFITEMNKKIFDVTKSADKQLGYFFVRPDMGNVISAERFLSKVLFFLWNDVFKDYCTGSIFVTRDTTTGSVTPFSLTDLFYTDITTDEVIINEKMMEQMMLANGFAPS